MTTPGRSQTAAMVERYHRLARLRAEGLSWAVIRERTGSQASAKAFHEMKLKVEAFRAADE